MDKAEILKDLFEHQFQYSDQNSLLDTDKRLYELITSHPNDFQLNLIYNEFRIANISKLPKTRPHILMGGSFNVIFPNFHTTPLFKIADVICITPVHKRLPYFSTLYCHISTQFLEILALLPKGFTPDLYLDQQIELCHYIPVGIENAPFPTIAGICHTFQHQTIEYICELFDHILPISRNYGEILKKKFPNKIINIPFGLNFASFSHIIAPQWSKDVDVCLTFPANIAPAYGNKRALIIELTKQFKVKYGSEFVIEISDTISKVAYIELLQRSRITINIVGINGPYNYRTLEAICAGSMLFQYEWEDHPFGDTFSELFIEGVHGVTFNFDNFENKLLYYLRNPHETERIAKEGYTFQNENYNYEKLYLQLFDEVKKCKIPLPRTIFEPTEGYLYRDLAYYYQNRNNGIANLIGEGLMNISQPPKTWIDYNNLMIYLVTVSLNSFGSSFLFALTAKMYPQYNQNNFKDLYHVFYKIAFKITPPEYLWIIKWNYFMIMVEDQKILKEDAKNMLTLLTDLSPSPFKEKGLFFKYYLNNTIHSNIGISEKDLDFQAFNIELLKNIDNPQARAILFRNYAIQKTMEIMALIA